MKKVLALILVAFIAGAAHAVEYVVVNFYLPASGYCGVCPVWVHGNECLGVYNTPCPKPGGPPVPIAVGVVGCAGSAYLTWQDGTPINGLSASGQEWTRYANSGIALNLCAPQTVAADVSDGGSSDAAGCGMPVWSVSEPYLSLWLKDEPLGYQPGLGSRVSLSLAYKQRELSAGLLPNLFSLGRRWNFDWFSYVSQDGKGSNVVHFGGGRTRTFICGQDYLTNTRLSGDTTNGFAIAYPDGSQDIYGLIVTNTTGVFQEAFLTERWDTHSQKTRFLYSSWTPSEMPVVRLQYVVDGDGQTNTVSYVSSNAFSTNLISQITDPFARSASFSYDNNGYLTSVTDVAEMSTSFIYDPNGWITNMTTPYGSTSFAITDDSGTASLLNGRSILVTEPDGGQQLFLYQDGATGVPSSYPSEQIPDASPFPTNSFANSGLHLRNTFHWGPLQYQHLSRPNIASFTANDFRLARMKHWMKSDTTTVIETLSMEREPSLDPSGATEGQKTWYNYEGQTNAEYAGSQALPLTSARVLPNGSTRFVRTERNELGFPTRTVESYSVPEGLAWRTNFFTYWTNSIDLLTVTNALNVQVSSNAYNSYHQVLTNYDALGELTVFTYNDNAQLTSVKRPSGLITTNLYFSSGAGSNHLSTAVDYAVISGSAVNYRTNSYTWANDLLATQTDPRGLTITNTWDNLQRLRRADFPDATFILNSYVNLDLVQVLDRMGFTNSFGYDSVRHLVAATNANGAVTRYGYCTCGALQAVTNAFGTALEQVTSHYYDNAGNLVQTIGPDGYSVVSSYNLLGQVTNVADSMSSITNWYNNQGLLFAVSNACGQVRGADYDILDRATTTFDANNVAIASAFDDLNRLVSRAYPDGGIEQFGYTFNVPGVTSYTNQLNSLIVTYLYDPLGRKSVEIYPGIATNFFTYSGEDLISFTDGRSQTTTWNYDEYGRTTNKVEATGSEILRFQYDANSRLVTRWSKEKGSTSYSYDAAGNNLGVVYPSSPSITFQYDLLNRLTNMVDAIGTTRYSYTAGNQLLSEDGPWANDTVSYTYTNGLRSSLSVQAPNASAWVQNYGYDGAKRLSTLSSPAGLFSYSYDPLRRLQVGSIALPNSASITNAYDSVGRLLSTVLKSSYGTNINSHAYGYDLAGQRTWLTNFAGDFRQFTYDNIGQLTSASATEPDGSSKRAQEQMGYAYDPAGNLAWRTNNAFIQRFIVNSVNQLASATNSGSLTLAGTTSSPATNVSVWGSSLSYTQATRYADNTWAQTNVTLPNGSATYNASAKDAVGHSDTNTVTVNLPGSVSFQYDANGNLTNDGLRSFIYDDENQLISVVVTNSVGNSTRSDFFYDGRMRRRIRTEYAWSGTSWVSNSTTLYVYDGNLVIQERDAGNLPVISYTRGRDLSGSLRGAGGIGGLLARTDHRLGVANDSGANNYYHGDGSGNITALVSGNQITLARYSYNSFGNIISQSGPLAALNWYRFSSKEQDAGSGLIYYGSRFYDPSLQKWLNPDPLGVGGEMNLYRFVGNSPLDGIDPDGRYLLSLTFLVIDTYIWGRNLANGRASWGDGARAGLDLAALALDIFSAGAGGELVEAVTQGARVERVLAGLGAALQSAKAIGNGDLAYTALRFAEFTFSRKYEAPSGLTGSGTGRTPCPPKNTNSTVTTQNEYEAYMNQLAKDNPILEAQRRAGVEEAWHQERQLAIAGEGTTRAWTRSELQELIEKGQVSGYEGHHINSVIEHPELASNPDNVMFVTRQQHFELHNLNWQTRTVGPLFNRTPWTR